jgi:hypothetical protein
LSCLYLDESSIKIRDLGAVLTLVIALLPLQFTESKSVRLSPRYSHFWIAHSVHSSICCFCCLFTVALHIGLSIRELEQGEVQ